MGAIFPLVIMYCKHISNKLEINPCVASSLLNQNANEWEPICSMTIFFWGASLHTIEHDGDNKHYWQFQATPGDDRCCVASLGLVQESRKIGIDSRIHWQHVDGLHHHPVKSKKSALFLRSCSSGVDNVQPYLKIPNRRAFQDLPSILNSNLKVGEGTARKSECQQFYPMYFEALHFLTSSNGVLNTTRTDLCRLTAF